MTPEPIAPSPENGPRDRSITQARDAALRFISYRPRSEAEVRRRLSPQYPEPIIEQVIASLRVQGFLDDAAFARLWRNHRERLRPRGQRRLRQELARLGVDRETTDAALEGFDEGENAYRAGQKYTRSLRNRAITQGITEEVFRQRLWGYLQRRGFSYGVAAEVAQRLWPELAADPLRGQDYAEDD